LPVLGDPRAAFLISGMTTSQSEDQMFLVRAIEKHSNIDWVKWEGWHAFRRGLATNLHALGVKPAVIQSLLRHSDINTTMNIYVQTVSHPSRPQGSTSVAPCLARTANQSKGCGH
jgi:site-specific recombinase XerD